GIGSHYAHLDVPKAIMGAKTRIGDEGLSAFVAHIRRHAAQFPVTLVSAEPFWRGMIGAKVNADSDSYWSARRKFITRVADIFPSDEVELVLVLRGQADFVESLFQEDVKVNRWRQNLRAFAAHRAHLLDYERQVACWAESFAHLRIMSFEDLRGTGDLVSAFFAGLGISTSGLPQAQIHNGSIQSDFVTALRLMNRSGLSDRAIKSAWKVLDRLQLDQRAVEWPGRSLWHSAAVREAFDAGFHAANDRLLATHAPGLPAIRSRLLPDTTKFGERPTEAALSLLLEHLCRDGPRDLPATPIFTT
ncbi:MAG: hypothetical protein AAF317_09370, partial [Pseudomonadota bacterium]